MSQGLGLLSPQSSNVGLFNATHWIRFLNPTFSWLDKKRERERDIYIYIYMSCSHYFLHNLMDMDSLFIRDKIRNVTKLHEGPLCQRLRVAKQA